MANSSAVMRDSEYWKFSGLFFAQSQESAFVCVISHYILVLIQRPILVLVVMSLDLPLLGNINKLPW